METRQYSIEWYLQIYNINYKLKQMTRVGSDHSCDIVINHESIAKNHITLHLNRLSVIVRDDNPEYHTLVNNTPIRNRARAYENQMIKIGELNFKLKRKIIWKSPTSFKESQIQISEISTTNKL